MAIRTVCDCNCGRELGEHDATRAPGVVFRTEKGITLHVQVVPNGKPVNIRPSCLKDMVAKAEQVFPMVPRAVDRSVPDEPRSAEPPEVDMTVEQRLEVEG